MKFYEELYVGENVKNPRKIKRKLKTNAGLVGVYCVIVCPGPDQLEICSSAVLMQPYYRKHPPYVVGIASSHKEAVDIVVRIAQEAFAANKSGDLKKYLLDKI